MCVSFPGLYKSVDAYAHAIPEELHSDYFEDMYKAYKKNKIKYAETGMPYTIAVIIASKSEDWFKQTKNCRVNLIFCNY